MVSAVATFTVLSPHRVCRADDTATRAATATMYGGSGRVEVGNNEASPFRYNQQHVGLGAHAVWRPWSAPEGATEGARGGFLQLGMVGEWRLLQLTSCGHLCSRDTNWDVVPEAHGGVRLGIGYDFRNFGIRGGLLYADSPKSRTAETLVMPDVQFRFGSASRGWFELGMGAYDASTMLRPGVYVGGGVVAGDFTIVARYGWHFAIGSFGHTIIQFGGRADVGAMYALLPNLHLGGGVALQNSRGFEPAFGSSRYITEFRAQASLIF